MIIDIVVPNLGESIKEATLTTWYKKRGDAVSADEALLELETDKVTIELPSPSAGVLIEVLAAEGDDVEVGTIVARLDESAQATAQAPAAEETVERIAKAEGAVGAPTKEAPRVQPAAEKEAAPIHLDPSAVARSGAGGKVTVSDLQAFFQKASNDQVERSGPAVRKLIAESGLDPTRIPASGKDGRFTKEDVEGYLAAQAKGGTARGPAPAAPAVPSTKAPPSGERTEERVRMSRMRRTIATRLKEVQNTAAILTTFNEADMSAVIDLRRRTRDAFEKRHGVRLGFMSFFVKACVAALQERPQANASIEGDEIVYKRYFDIGVAVSTDEGLKVPVVRNADAKSFAQIEKEIADLAVKAREGTLTMEEMEGSTFSITNGGVFGSLLSTPILNAPNSAILGLHKIEERPVVVNGEIVVRPMMYLALSYDHRMIDGRDSVAFLVRVKELIEDPGRLMLDS